MTVHRVQINQSLQGKATANVMWWDIPDTSTPAIQEFADTFRVAVSNEIAPFMSDQWILKDMLLRPLDGGGPYSFNVFFTNGQLSGDDPADILPSQVAVLVSGTYQGPRPNRTREYWGGLCEGSSGSSGWTSNVMAAFEDFYQILGAGLANGFSIAFPRIVRPDWVNNTPEFNNPVDSYIVRQRSGTIRNRRLA